MLGLKILLRSILVAQGMPDLPKEYNILAFDYGNVRIGVAVGNSLLKIPHPLMTLGGESLNAKIAAIEPVIAKWQPAVLVVGLPQFSDNPQKIQLINTIKNFGKRLASRFDLPVNFVNEDYSSGHASSLLNEQGVHGRSQKAMLDQLAACAILESFFADCS